ncbi:hypothetical protein M407DRAFT_33751 [Tulasnella calospora MUT 4182]|uniref:Uncharacterized protein n=1 Tax=Tulasnella calospora MUT 4182 TaxID=1051891 RepID=A0A0C3L4R1_9AGAM|nr:hypothetical protein M407DRAFT_33751 [Tulasnella calospora MUT 4182]
MPPSSRTFRVHIPIVHLDQSEHWKVDPVPPRHRTVHPNGLEILAISRQDGPQARGWSLRYGESGPKGSTLTSKWTSVVEKIGPER